MTAMLDPLDLLRRELAGRYAVEQELGRGGMAVVYLARDLRHDRRVAIKVVRSDGAVNNERFLREIRTVAQFHHPHILALHDSGTAGDHLFYVMPYVDGETLRQRLERTGPLPVDDAIRLTREVADALDYAHGRGVVHRDIKPENIFLSAGHALVADFGIAKAADAAGFNTTLTETGLAIGTPAYMSPEQATADPRIDGRSDQYALACVLYELLAGQPPFTGPTSQAVMARHTADPVPPLRTVRAVPAQLESAITKALAKVPADRWPSARAFSDSLALPLESAPASPSSTSRRSRAAILAVTALAVIAAATFAVGRASAGDESAQRQSVAVIPFSVSGDSIHATLVDGLADGVVNGLVRVDGLDVLPSTRTIGYDGQQEDPRDIARKLGVNIVVTGRVRVSGNAFRVTPQLVDGVSGRILWSDEFNGEFLIDGELQDIFSIQDVITGKIVDALRPQLAPAQRSVVERGVRTRDPRALGLYLEGRRAMYMVTRGSVERAIQLFEQALARDSSYADAWVGLADAYSFYAQVGGLPPADVASRWRRAASRGIELDSLSGYAHAMRGMVRALSDWDWEGARSDYRRGLKLEPSSAEASIYYAQFLFIMNEFDSGFVHVQRAATLDPKNAFYHANLAGAHLLRGKLDSVEVEGQKALALDSTQWVGLFMLSMARQAAGRDSAAADAAERMRQIVGESQPLGLAWLANYYGRAGRRDDARRVLEQLERLARTQHVQSTHIAAARLAAGDRDGALDALELAARNHDLDLPPDLAFPHGPYRTLVGEPRYEQVVREVFGSLSGRLTGTGSGQKR